MNKCEYSYVPWFIFDDRLDYDPSNVIMVIITQATSEGSNYPAHQHSFVRVTERRRWRLPYQTGKTVHVHAKHYKHNEDGGTKPGVCGNVSVPLSHPGNVVTRIGIHTHTPIIQLAI